MSVRILPLAVLGDPLRLQPLAERIFGTGQRRADWLARKLARECVDPQLSRVAIDGDVDDADAWRGYVLVGTPPSRHPAARTAGTGVVPDARGRGIGRALVEAALAAVAASDRDLDALEILAEDGREPFYERLGFTRVHPFATLLAFGRGPAQADPALPPPLPWDPGPGYREHQAFLAEAWERTPARERGSVRIATRSGAAILHVCRENRALAIHRTLVPEGANDIAAEAVAHATYDAWLDCIPAGVPTLVIGVQRVSSITHDAAPTPHTGHTGHAGWAVVQHGTLVRARAGQAQHGPR